MSNEEIHMKEFNASIDTILALGKLSLNLTLSEVWIGRSIKNLCYGGIIHVRCETCGES
jgi:hypothetical protein